MNQHTTQSEICNDCGRKAEGFCGIWLCRECADKANKKESKSQDRLGGSKEDSFEKLNPPFSPSVKSSILTARDIKEEIQTHDYPKRRFKSNTEFILLSKHNEEIESLIRNLNELENDRDLILSAKMELERRSFERDAKLLSLKDKYEKGCGTWIGVAIMCGTDGLCSDCKAKLSVIEESMQK